MEPGNIVEYIENQKITCAVVLEIKQKRLRVLTENNKEVSLAPSRVSFKSANRISLAQSREKLIKLLKDTASRRNILMEEINIEEIWEVFNEEPEWIDLAAMTSFCFLNDVTPDHGAAVIRAFFKDRTYFKFDHNRFLPYSQDHVNRTINQKKEKEKQERFIQSGIDWLKRAKNSPSSMQDVGNKEYINIIQSYYLFGKESPVYEIGSAMLAKAGLASDSGIFSLMVKLGVWDENENLDLLRQEVPIKFSIDSIKEAREINESSTNVPERNERFDLTTLDIVTIDGPATLDFDDALSIEEDGSSFQVGIHISDVSCFIPRGGRIDQEARERASSIYLPETAIPMLPEELSHGSCSLLAGTPRPAISILARLDRLAQIMDYEIQPSIIKVKDRLTYDQADRMAMDKGQMKDLHDLARMLRKNRLDRGALQLTLPEVNLALLDDGGIEIQTIDRESPGRMLVAEMMILANGLMADFLVKREMPAIFRSQPQPKKRILKDDEGTLFQNCMQRKNLSRGVLDTMPEHHSGLGLDAYVTATSPIRRYFDLVTQRQIRGILGLETPYTEKEMSNVINSLEPALQQIAKLQFTRKRFWILKYLEKKTGTKEEAVVLDKRRDAYWILIPRLMIECSLPSTIGSNPKPGDLIQITIQHANARKGVLSVYLG